MRACWLVLSGLLLSIQFGTAAALPVFNFTAPAGADGWESPHDAALSPTTDGLLINISGQDPYFTGPPCDYPARETLWLQIELNSEVGGMAQIFFFDKGPSEENSVRFFVPGGVWSRQRVPLPALGPNTRLRFDPPGTTGACRLRQISFEPRPLLAQPAWPPASSLNLGPDSLAITSGPVQLRHDPRRFGAFALAVAGQRMAQGHARLPVGYAGLGGAVWLELTNSTRVSLAQGVISAKTELTDPDGAQWRLEQTFKPASLPGAIQIQSRVEVSADRDVLFLPLLLLFPGIDSFGTNKSQALLAGVEYLENEPSSSEADVIGPGSLRRVPDSHKIVFPLMALAAHDRYLALSWDKQPQVSALFDSPDRVFGSPGHLMGLVFPGSSPEVRMDGGVLPYAGVRLKSGDPLQASAVISGGTGQTVVPAVQDYIQRHPFPPIPEPGYAKAAYFDLAAHGWLDSQIRDGANFRHAVGAGFAGQPSPEAALYMRWLSPRVSDASLSARLASASDEALAQVPPAQYNSITVGHIRSPSPALAFGNLLENAQTALAEGQMLLNRFQPDGSFPLPRPGKGNDLGRTHRSREANGLAATYVSAVLDRAVFTGDPKLTEDGLRLVRHLARFRDTVPRGAQTWEVPLHTPDILASAYLVHAFTLAFELTGESDFLDQARYWAWTGVPFLYLSRPSSQPVGLYATIPVLGATQWTAPLWIGLPVQWCGLVYGHAIRRLARYDASAPWTQIADGIAFSGVQQTHPPADREYQGLLPDSFDVVHQVRNPVPINPATLLADAIEAFGEAPLSDYRVYRAQGITVHAPGPITTVREAPNEIAFTVAPWQPAWVLVNGCPKPSEVRMNGRSLDSTQYRFISPRLEVKIEGSAEIEIIRRLN